jgi:PAS domain S-box-containing protein
MTISLGRPMERPVILNVNDDEARRYLLARILRRGGFDVIEAATGGEGLALAASARPDLLLLDVKLPDVSGFEVCQRVKADPTTAAIPVVMYSAVMVDTTDRVHGLESGADGYLTDPLQPPVVIATLRALLRARAAEDARRESEAQYRVLFESNPLPSWVVDLDTLTIVAVNEAAVREFGFARGELIGMHIASVRGPAEVPRLCAVMEGPDRGLDGPSLWQYTRRDGSVFDAEVTTRRTRYQGRDARIVVAQDVTERRRAEARFAAQFAVTRVLAESPSVDDALPQLLGAIGECLGWDVGEFWMHDPTAGALLLKSAWQSRRIDARDLEATGRRHAVGRGQGVPGRAWETGHAVWSTEIGDDSMVRSDGRHVDLRAAFAFPVTRGDDVAGVIVFLSRESRGADAELLRTIGGIGAQIGEFIERRRAEEALREAEARYRMVARATNDVIWDWDVTRDVVTVSEAMTTQFGYLASAAGPTMTWLIDRVHVNERPRVRDGIAAALAGTGAAWSDEFRFRTATGTYATVANRAYIVRDEQGRAQRMVGAMTDITERARAEERRRLRILSIGVLRAREEEARRIARELHDEAGQLLASVHIAVDRLATDVPEVDQKRLSEIKGLLELTEAELRRIAHELRPTVLDDLGLVPALAMLADNVSVRSRLDVRLEAAVDDRLPALVETALYRIVQEAVANAVKHAQASRVTVRLDADDAGVRCTVSDDGVGFDVANVLARTERGLGLLGIEERLESLRGALAIDSRPGAGTRLIATIPLSRDGAARPPR